MTRLVNTRIRVYRGKDNNMELIIMIKYHD